MLDDVECTAEEDDAKYRTEEKGSVRCEVLESKEAQLDKDIAALQTNNVRILQRFYVSLNAFSGKNKQTKKHIKVNLLAFIMTS